jgi:hypothetical protein
MTRPIYENEVTLKNERTAADYLESLWGATLRKLPISYRIDFFVEKNGVGVGLVEFKRFNSKHNDFACVISSMSKWAKGIYWSKIFNIPYYLVIRFDDGIYGVRCSNEKNYNVKWFERKNFRSEGDAEPCVFIPHGDFTNIAKMGDWI